jgi:hypothetical protein
MGVDEACLLPQIASKNGLAGPGYEARPAFGDNFPGPCHTGGDLKDVARLIAKLKGGSGWSGEQRNGTDPKRSS